MGICFSLIFTVQGSGLNFKLKRIGLLLQIQILKHPLL